MARRRSLNRRSFRGSLNISGLDDNTETIDRNDPMWFENLAGDVTVRQSHSFTTGVTIPSVLSDDSRVNVSTLQDEWWSDLDHTTPGNNTGQKTLKRRSLRLEISDESADTDDTSDIGIKKRKLLHKPQTTKHKDHEKDVFAEVVSTAAASKKGTDRGRESSTDKIGKTSRKSERLNDDRLQNDESRSDQSDIDSIVKTRPKPFKKRVRSSSENPMDNAVQTPAEVPARVSKSASISPRTRKPRSRQTSNQKSVSTRNSSSRDNLNDSEIMGPPKGGSPRKKSVSTTQRVSSDESDDGLKKLRRRITTKNRKSSINPFEQMIEKLSQDTNESQKTQQEPQNNSPSLRRSTMETRRNTRAPKNKKLSMNRRASLPPSESTIDETLEDEPIFEKSAAPSEKSLISKNANSTRSPLKSGLVTRELEVVVTRLNSHDISVHSNDSSGIDANLESNKVTRSLRKSHRISDAAYELSEKERTPSPNISISEDNDKQNPNKSARESRRINSGRKLPVDRTRIFSDEDVSVDEEIDNVLLVETQPENRLSVPVNEPEFPRDINSTNAARSLTGILPVASKSDLTHRSKDELSSVHSISPKSRLSVSNGNTISLEENSQSLSNVEMPSPKESDVYESGNDRQIDETSSDEDENDVPKSRDQSRRANTSKKSARNLSIDERTENNVEQEKTQSPVFNRRKSAGHRSTKSHGSLRPSSDKSQREITDSLANRDRSLSQNNLSKEAHPTSSSRSLRTSKSRGISSIPLHEDTSDEETPEKSEKTGRKSTKSVSEPKSRKSFRKSRTADEPQNNEIGESGSESEAPSNEESAIPSSQSPLTSKSRKISSIPLQEDTSDEETPEKSENTGRKSTKSVSEPKSRKSFRKSRTADEPQNIEIGESASESEASSNEESAIPPSQSLQTSKSRKISSIPLQEDTSDEETPEKTGRKSTKSISEPKSRKSFRKSRTADEPQNIEIGESASESEAPSNEESAIPPSQPPRTSKLQKIDSIAQHEYTSDEETPEQSERTGRKSTKSISEPKSRKSFRKSLAAGKLQNSEIGESASESEALSNEESAIPPSQTPQTRKSRKTSSIALHEYTSDEEPPEQSKKTSRKSMKPISDPKSRQPLRNSRASSKPQNKEIGEIASDNGVEQYYSFSDEPANENEAEENVTKSTDQENASKVVKLVHAQVHAPNGSPLPKSSIGQKTKTPNSTTSKTPARTSLSRTYNTTSTGKSNTTRNRSRLLNFGIQPKITDFGTLKFSEKTGNTPNEASQTPKAASVFNEKQIEAMRKKAEEVKNTISEKMVSSRVQVTSAPAFSIRNQTKRKASDSGKKVKIVDKAYIVNGQVYKQPKLPRPKYWVTDRLYRHLWKLMEPKYGLATRVKSANFIVQLSEIVTLTLRRKKYESYKSEIEALLKVMAQLGIIKTRNDFYHFCYDFLPSEFHVKVTPMALPGNKRIVPYDPSKLHTPITP